MGCAHEKFQAVSPRQLGSNNRQQEDLNPPISGQRESIIQNLELTKQSTKISTLQSSQQVLLTGIDRRIVNKNLEYPYNCIFKLSYKTKENGKKSSINATGVLVAPDILITAAHFLAGHRMDSNNEIITAFPQFPENMHLTHDDYIEQSQQVEFYEYFQNYSGFERSIQRDFGFVKLRSPIKKDKYIKIGINFNITNYPAEICGFQYNKQKKMKGLIEEIMKQFLLSYSFNKAKSLFKERRNHQSLAVCLTLIKQGKLNNIMMLLIFNLLGLNYEELNNLQIAQIFYAKCMKIAEDIPQDMLIKDPNFLSIIETFNNLGAINLEKDKLCAERFFKKSKGYLILNKATQTEHFAAAIINLTIIQLGSKQLNNSQAMARLTDALEILQKDNRSNLIVGKIYIIQNMLKILFKQEKYEEWLELILQKMETILLMKVEEGIYDRLNDEPIDSSHIEELHRVEYTRHTLEIDKNHHLPAYFVSWYEQLLDQADLLISYYNNFKGTFQLKFCFVFSKLSKGLAGNKVTQLLTNMRNMRNLPAQTNVAVQEPGTEN